MGNIDDYNYDSEDIFGNHADDLSPEDMLTLHFCDCCDNNITFYGDEDDFETVIVKLVEIMTVAHKLDAEYHLKKAIELAIKQFPDSMIFKIWKLRYLFLTKRLDSAKRYYRQISESFTNSAELFEEMALASYEYKLKDFNSEEFAKKAIALEPTSIIYFLLAKISLDKGDVSNAFNYFQDAYDLDVNALNNIDDIVIRRHIFEFEHNHLEDIFNDKILINIESDDTSESLVNITDYDIKFLKKLADTYPLEYTVWRSLGNAYMLRKDYTKAIEAFHFSISAAQTPQSYIALCQAYFSIKDYDKTIEYSEYISNNFDNISANVLIATAKHCQNKFSEALTYLLKADQTDFSFPMLLPEMVAILDDAGRIDELPYFFDKISDKIKLNVQDSNFLLEVFFDIKSLESFKFICKNVRNLFKEDHLYCAYLTIIALDLNISGEYLPFDCLEECISNPKDDETYEHIGYFLAILYMLDNNPEKAESHLKNAIVINKDNIYEDFFEIDIEEMYTKFQNIFDIVFPYL